MPKCDFSLWEQNHYIITVGCYILWTNDDWVAVLHMDIDDIKEVLLRFNVFIRFKDNSKMEYFYFKNEEDAKKAIEWVESIFLLARLKK